MATYYIAPTPNFPGRYDLRQTRFREGRQRGFEHPHDLCATCFPPEELKKLITTGCLAGASVEPFEFDQPTKLEINNT